MSGQPEVVVILQARMGSTRLPGKAMQPITGRPLLVHCLERLLAADVGQVVLATTPARDDDVLADLAMSYGVSVVRGAEHDVLGRFIAVIDRYPAPVCIRATGDNPVVDIDAPRRVLDVLDATQADHAVETGLPYGTAVEAVRTSTLRRADQSARTAADREHVTTWIRRHAAGCRAERLPAPRHLHRPDLRMTVDTPRDLDDVRRLMTEAGAREGSVPLRHVIRTADQLRDRQEVA